MTSSLERRLLLLASLLVLVPLPVACTGQDPSSLLYGQGPPGGTGRPPTSPPGGGPGGRPTPANPPASQPPASQPSSQPSPTATAPTPPPPAVDASAPNPPVDAAVPPPIEDAAPLDDTSTLGAPILDSQPANAPTDSSPATLPDAPLSTPDTSTPDTSVADTSTTTTADAGVPETSTADTSTDAPLGSCANPQCDTDDQGDCFCTAQVNGQAFQLGCGPDGTCACFLDQQISSNTISDPGVCNDLTAASALFVQLCACQ